jgi:hypothetical protein
MVSVNLIDQLARDVEPVAHRALERSIGAGLGAGAVGALGLVLALYGVQPDLGTFAHGAPLLMKWAYALTVAIVALAMALVLSRPGAAERDARWLALPIVALAALALWQLAQVTAAARADMMMGSSWDKCPWRIVALAMPVMAGLIVTARRQAPVRLRRTGAAIGLLSGATAATLYALACTESSAAFVLIWYSLGIALATGIGALVGPRLLRW